MQEKDLKNTENIAKTIKVISFGCGANFGEGEMIAGLLQKDGFDVKIGEELTDLTVLNLCTVKGNSSAIKSIKKTLTENKDTKLILTGCVTPSLAEEVKKFYSDASMTTTHSLKKVPEIVRQLLAGNKSIDFDRGKDIKINLPRVRNSKVTGIVPICSGCLDACTFCSTRLVKGMLYSYPEKDIIEDIKNLIDTGCKEIWLTGQDSSCYGFDFDYDINLAKLIKHILAEVPGKYFIRVGMGNPRHLLKYIDEMVEIFEDPRVYRFIHLPVQAGSDNVLKLMARQHSVADYEFLINKIREKYSDLTLSTDVIVAFPGETEEDFEQTLEVIKRSKPSICNRTRFVAREGTKAAKLPNNMSKIERRARSAKVTELFKGISLKNNQGWVGWKGEVLINEFGTHGTWSARNYAYKQIILNGDYELGQYVNVELVRADVFYLEAKEIDA